MQTAQMGRVPAPKVRLYSVSRTLPRPKGASFPPVRVKYPSISVLFMAAHDTQSILWAYRIFWQYTTGYILS